MESGHHHTMFIRGREAAVVRAQGTVPGLGNRARGAGEERPEGYTEPALPRFPRCHPAGEARTPRVPRYR